MSKVFIPYREIFSHPDVIDAPHDQIVFLLFLCNNILLDDKEMNDQGVRVMLKAGQFMGTIRGMAKQANVNVKAVERGIERFKKSGVLGQEVGHIKTVLTLLLAREMKSCGTRSGTEKNTSGTESGTRMGQDLPRRNADNEEKVGQEWDTNGNGYTETSFRLKETDKEKIEPFAAAAVVPLTVSPFLSHKANKKEASSEDVSSIIHFVEFSGYKVEVSDVEKWVHDYGVDRVSRNVSYTISRKPTSKFGGYLRRSIENDYAQAEINTDINRDFAFKFKKKNKVVSLTLHKRYCKDENGNDYDYKLDPEQFKEILEHKFKEG